MAGVHRPRERVGVRALPGPVLNVSPPSAPLFHQRHSICIFVQVMHELLYTCAAVAGDELQSVHRIVHIMHKFTVTTNAEGDMDANTVAINFVWTLVAGFLVMFMQAGFAAVESGFTRAKNAAHTMTMNFMIYPIGMIGYWICGYALQIGGVGAVSTLGGTAPLNHELTVNLFGHPFGLLGLKGFFLSGD